MPRLLLLLSSLLFTRAITDPPVVLSMKDGGQSLQSSERMLCLKTITLKDTHLICLTQIVEASYYLQINVWIHFCTKQGLCFVCHHVHWKHVREGSFKDQYEQKEWLQQGKPASLLKWASDNSFKITSRLLKLQSYPLSGIKNWSMTWRVVLYHSTRFSFVCDVLLTLLPGIKFYSDSLLLLTYTVMFYMKICQSGLVAHLNQKQKDRFSGNIFRVEILALQQIKVKRGKRRCPDGDS